jgi:hypothetical protein
MNAGRASPSSADVATEANTLLAGLGILTIQIFPFALPLLLFVIAPLALAALAGALLAAPVVIPVWLARVVLRSRSGNPSPAVRPV